MLSPLSLLVEFDIRNQQLIRVMPFVYSCDTSNKVSTRWPHSASLTEVCLLSCEYKTLGSRQVILLKWTVLAQDNSPREAAWTRVSNRQYFAACVMGVITKCVLIRTIWPRGDDLSL